MCKHATLFQLLWSGLHDLVYELAHGILVLITLSFNNDLGACLRIDAGPPQQSCSPTQSIMGVEIIKFSTCPGTSEWP